MEELTMLVTGALGILIALFPVLLIPAIVGAITFGLFSDDSLGRLAGFFTLKPLPASALFGLILLASPAERDPKEWALWSVIPGVALTVLIVWNFRHLYIPATGLPYLFLAADVLRWGNTYVLVSSLGPELNLHPEAYPGFWISLVAAGILPSAYAIMAIVILTTRRDRRAAEQHLAVPGV